MSIITASGPRLRGWTPPAFVNPFDEGVWNNISPPGITAGTPEEMLAMGVTVGPDGLVHWNNGPYDPGRMYRSAYCGIDWDVVGTITPWYEGAPSVIQNPLHTRINPNNHDQLTHVCGVRSETVGLYTSTDGGTNLTRLSGTGSALANAVTGAGGANFSDFYDIAHDPNDWNKAFASFHFGNGGSFGENSGLIKTSDLFATCTFIEPPGAIGTGHSITYLSSTRLLWGTQSGGYWLSTDTGSTWNQVYSDNITHGGCQPCYHGGRLYVPGTPVLLVSDDDGETFEEAYAQPTWAAISDGTYVYTSSVNGGRLKRSTDGVTWTDYDTHEINGGVFSFAYDAVNKILYMSIWDQGASNADEGLYALRLA